MADDDHPAAIALGDRFQNLATTLHQGTARLAAGHDIVRIAAPPAGILLRTGPIQLVAAVALKDANLDFDQAGLLANGKGQGRGDRFGRLAGTPQGAAKDRLRAQALADLGQGRSLPPAKFRERNIQMPLDSALGVVGALAMANAEHQHACFPSICGQNFHFRPLSPASQGSWTPTQENLKRSVDAELGIVYDTTMSVPEIVVDTCVVIAALRSQLARLTSCF